MTTSTCRPRAATTVVKDIEHMGHAADKAHKEPHEPITDHVGAADTYDFPGGP